MFFLRNFAHVHVTITHNTADNLARTGKTRMQALQDVCLPVRTIIISNYRYIIQPAEKQLLIVELRSCLGTLGDSMFPDGRCSTFKVHRARIFHRCGLKSIPWVLKGSSTESSCSRASTRSWEAGGGALQPQRVHYSDLVSYQCTVDESSSARILFGASYIPPAWKLGLNCPC